MSSPDRAARTDSLLATSPAVARPAPARADQISTDSAAALKSALASQPEIRPEVVARASALAADPNYPSISIIRHVAGQILAAPDLSESEA